jgi:sugar phosphate isomerase/epimerase
LGTPEGFSNEEYRALIDEVGIKVITAGILDHHLLLANDFSAKINECKVLGAMNVMISMDKLVLGNAEELKKFIKRLNNAGKVFRDEGLYLSYHNYALDFTKINGATIFQQILEQTNPDYVFIAPDTYWVQAGGAHIITWLKKLTGRIFCVHFMDYAIDQYSDHTFLECTHRRFAEVGEGNLNWQGIIAECLKQKIEWCVVEQNVTQRPAYVAIELSYKNLAAFGL